MPSWFQVLSFMKEKFPKRNGLHAKSACWEIISVTSGVSLKEDAICFKINKF